MVENQKEVEADAELKKLLLNQRQLKNQRLQRRLKKLSQRLRGI